MYRQILVAKKDQEYQQILWRNNSNEDIRTYKLKTVTYGLASASFLATRCIKQIALDNKDNPSLSRVLQEDIYIDDLLTRSDIRQITQSSFMFPIVPILTADNTIELHGSADASSLAYAAAIYCQQKHDGKIKDFTHYTFDVFAWTDSKIVLSWLSSHPRKWKTFVSNRTSEIMDVLPTKHWRHAPSKENPADIASRGIDPKCLPDCMLWWQGPP
ncbi:uncharacterized protein TNCV_4354701 [Trichonephila clavipes]|nr:uncharacterized protein TNCV_4354701 [Trichonephila clavipes]